MVFRRNGGYGGGAYIVGYGEVTLPMVAVTVKDSDALTMVVVMPIPGRV